MKVLAKLLLSLAVTGYCVWCGGSAQSVMAATAATTTPLIMPQEKKVMNEFHGVRLGYKKAQVTAALGKPSTSDESRDEFSFDGDNQITVHYDNGEVKAIQVSFVTAGKVPTWTEVIGDAEISQTESGAKVARKIVNAEHFWVSMYQNKDGSVTRITISR